MGLKLWKHNHDRQIAEDHISLYCVPFAPWLKSGVFFLKAAITWLKSIPDSDNWVKLFLHSLVYSQFFEMTVCNV